MEEIKVGPTGSLLNKESSLKNLIRERDLIQGIIDEINQRKLLLDEEVTLYKRNCELSQEAFVFLKPNWKFEENPEYMENLKQINRINNTRKLWELESAEKTTQSTLKSQQEQLDSVVKEIERITKEIEKMKGESQ